MTPLLGSRQRVLLLGGLGNQLFQLAFGRYLAGLGAQVDFQAGTRSPPAVGRLLPELSIAPAPLRGTGPIGRAHILGDMARRLRGWGSVVDLTLHGESGVEPPSQDTVWAGYFQDERFVEGSRVVADVGDALVRWLPTEWTGGRERPLVCVHVRRGDYLAGTPTLGVDYYWDALNGVSRELDEPVASLDVVVVTDDPDWVWAKCQFPARRLHVQSLTAFADLATMAAADACVLSQSTFSWWGARVRPGRPVASPSPWRLGSDPAGHAMALESWLPVEATYTEPRPTSIRETP